MERFTENYRMVQATLQEPVQAQSSLCGTSKTAIKGHEKVLKTFEALLGIDHFIALFGPCEELARMIQHPVCHTAGTKESSRGFL